MRAARCVRCGDRQQRSRGPTKTEDLSLTLMSWEKEGKAFHGLYQEDELRKEGEGLAG